MPRGFSTGIRERTACSHRSSALHHPRLTTLHGLALQGQARHVAARCTAKSALKDCAVPLQCSRHNARCILQRLETRLRRLSDGRGYAHKVVYNCCDAAWQPVVCDAARVGNDWLFLAQADLTTLRRVRFVCDCIRCALRLLRSQRMCHAQSRLLQHGRQCLEA